LQAQNQTNNAFFPISLNPNGGNVGIGTATPGAPFQVRGAGNANLGTIRLDSSNPFTSITSRQNDSVGEPEGFASLNNSYDGTNNFIALGGGLDEFNAATRLSFYTAPNVTTRTGVARMVIDQIGNVGIGTTTPSHKLAVNGAIRAKEVIVDTNWADYVFEADYRLAPLAEVESHIKAKKHLPGIPSAAEVAEHGVSMGDMQAKLLSKVEELTLHLIAQEKRLTQLEAENRDLRAQLRHP
jgi:hypothetical protein